MEGNIVLYQLMVVRMENVMSGITESNAFYQETKQKTGKYFPYDIFANRSIMQKNGSISQGKIIFPTFTICSLWIQKCMIT